MAVDQSMDVVLRALQGVFQADDGIKLLLETLARHAMAQEVTRHLGAGDYERTEGRRGHRNGTKPRTLATRVGRVELDVPQVRGCEPYHPSRLPSPSTLME